MSLQKSLVSRKTPSNVSLQGQNGGMDALVIRGGVAHRPHILFYLEYCFYSLDLQNENLSLGKNQTNSNYWLG